MAHKLDEVGVQNCYVNDVVVAELLVGAYYSEHMEENMRQVNDFINMITVIPFADSVHTFAKERVRLWSTGQKIEDFDLLIGCAAKATGLTMVTHNMKHFCHIDGIVIEDWVI